MADTTTGVTPSRGRGRGRGGSFFRRNRAMVLGGGALGAFLLMSHKGGSAQGNSSNNQQGNLAAYQQGLQDASGLVGQSVGATGSLGGGDSGTVGGGGVVGDSTGSLGGDGGTAAGAGNGGAGDVAGPLATGSAPVGPINVTVNAPGGSKRKPKPSGGGKGKGSHGKPGKHPPKPSGGHNTTKQRGAPSHKGGNGGRATVRPKQAAQGRPAPAHSNGRHPSTPKRTSTGKKRRSPAEVESIFGVGAGIVVNGRQFPGAQSYRMGPPMRSSDGTVCRRVIVDYGGRTEQHIMLGNGSDWLDNAPGLNPPSRGVPQMMTRGDAR